MCESSLHPRPAFSTYLSSDVPYTNSKTVYRTLKQFQSKERPKTSTYMGHKPPDTIKVRTLYTPISDCISSIPSPAIHALLQQSTALQSRENKAGCGGHAISYKDANIDKPPHLSTPMQNSIQTTSRPKTAPAHMGSNNIWFSEDRRPKTTEPRKKEYDVTVTCEKSNSLPKYKLIGGEYVTEIEIKLPQSEAERDALELKSRYTSVSHKTMQELEWQASPPTIAPCRAARPDMVTQRIPLYESKAHAWQCVGPAFDRASPRRQYTSPRPINYISESRQTKHTPGYTGEIPLISGEKGRVDIPFVMKTNVRRELPPATNVSTRANVVGYTGCTYYTEINPAHSNTVPPHPTTSRRTHREYPVKESQATFGKPSPISNLVTLTHPYNPFNVLNPTIKQRA